jgi:hypothetical protein
MVTESKSPDLGAYIESTTEMVSPQIRQHINPLFGLDIIVYTPARIQQRLALGDSFLREVLTKGVVLYERTNI